MTRGVLFLVCTFLIFVVRLESPLLHVLDIRGSTGVTTFACWYFLRLAIFLGLVL